MKNTTKPAIKRFYLGLLLPIAIFALYLGFITLILESSGERLSTASIVQKLDKTGGNYGSALYQRTFYYKANAYRYYSPEVAVLGSSRVLQFRRKYFKPNFVNLGSIGMLDDIIEMSHDIFSKHPPKILILSIDYWWLNASKDFTQGTRHPEKVKITLADLMEIGGWIIAGKLSPSDIISTLSGKTSHLGIAAISRGDGFDSFGSYFYNSVYTGTKHSQDKKLKNTLRRADKGDGIFTHSQNTSNASWEKIESLLDFLDSLNIETIVILPPVAPSVLDALSDKSRYAYINEVRTRLDRITKKRRISYFDFHDVRNLGTNDCEFYDGLHGGENTYNRMLKYMAERRNGLRDMLDIPKLESAIVRLKGRASAVENEIDFLELGCDKTFKTDQRELSSSSVK